MEVRDAASLSKYLNQRAWDSPGYGDLAAGHEGEGGRCGWAGWLNMTRYCDLSAAGVLGIVLDSGGGEGRTKKPKIAKVK